MDAANQRLNLASAQYSPVARRPFKKCAPVGRPKPIIGGVDNQETSFKYLDDDDDDNDDELQHREKLRQDLRRSPIFKQLSASQDVISGRGSRAIQEPEPDYYSDSVDDATAAQVDEEEELEEVYLCNWCGVTRQLKPAMKYMPLFRGLFTLFNLLALIFALANSTIGLWFRLDPRIYELHFYIETQNFTLAGWILLACGLATILLTLTFTCSSRSRQSTCMLIFYALLMGSISALLIGTLVLLLVYGLGTPLERFLTKEIYEQIRRRTMSAEPMDLASSSEGAQFLDFVQVKLRCCGAQDFRDYSKLGMVVPTTCYTVAGPYMNAPGCGQALRELLDLRAGLAAGLAAGAALIHLLATLSASLMVCSIYNYRATARPTSRLSLARGDNLTHDLHRVETPI